MTCFVFQKQIKVALGISKRLVIENLPFFLSLFTLISGTLAGKVYLHEFKVELSNHFEAFFILYIWKIILIFVKENKAKENFTNLKGLKRYERTEGYLRLAADKGFSL